MRKFFRREEEEIQETEDLDLIDLDETAGWSKLDVAQQLAKQREAKANAAKMLEEIGDELAVIDVVDEASDIGLPEQTAAEKLPEDNNTYMADGSGKLAGQAIGYLSEEELGEEDEEYFSRGRQEEELGEEDVEYLSQGRQEKELGEEDVEYLSQGRQEKELGEEDVEYLSQGRQEEELSEEDAEYLSEEESEEELGEEDVEYLSDEESEEELGEEDVEYLTMDEEEEDDEEEESPFAFFENLAAFLGKWSMMDKVVAAAGVLVLALAVVTAGAYFGKRNTQRQIEALAPVGEQLETVGVIGEDKLLAVADAHKAMLEASKLEEELMQEYDEEELSNEVQVVMRMTSVQKDLKIKFVNKKSGKLVGNVPFEVTITDANKKTYSKIDEDQDGIIYLTQLEPGTYSVAMVELEGLEGYSFTTARESIKVKENIEYQKIDVSDEVKDESQVDASKEDTAGKLETEGALTDTVEWVESTKTESGSQVVYTPVDKSNIADPSLSARNILDRNFFRTSIIKSISDNDTPGGGDTGNEEGGDTTVAVTGVTLSAGTLTLTKGDTGALTATVAPENATDKTVTWSSSDTSVATVDNNGAVKAVKAGTAIITVTSQADTTKSASCTVTVNAPAEVAVTGVTLDKTELSLETGKTEALTAAVAPENATDKTITWSSSDTSVATVDSAGVVTAVKKGTTTITAKAGEKTATCTVMVTEKAAGTTIALDKTTASMKVGESLTLKATVTPADKTVTWSTSKAEVATVENGKVTAKAAGTATITATADGKTATCTITVTTAYDPKKDTSTDLKDKSGNKLYYYSNGQYVEAKVADYYKSGMTFFKKESTSQYRYTGWQNIDGNTYYFDKNGNKVTGEQVIQGAKYSFNSDGILNTGSGILGIDVSKWNGNIDWQKVKNAGVSYAIIRTGYRGSSQGALIEDPKFRANIQGAINAGIKVGVYFFTQAINEVEAVEEASMVINQIKGYKITYPVFIDVESSGGRADSLDAGTRTKVINAFCQTIRNSGYTAGIYANKTWLNQKMNVSALSGYKIWLAQYNTKPTYGGRYDMWQYSDKGRINGISTNVDLNLSYMSY